MTNIDEAASLSGGEWKPGLDEALVTKLLDALETLPDPVDVGENPTSSGPRTLVSRVCS